MERPLEGASSLTRQVTLSRDSLRGALAMRPRDGVADGLADGERSVGLCREASASSPGCPVKRASSPRRWGPDPDDRQPRGLPPVRSDDYRWRGRSGWTGVVDCMCPWPIQGLFSRRKRFGVCVGFTLLRGEGTTQAGVRRAGVRECGEKRGSRRFSSLAG